MNHPDNNRESRTELVLLDPHITISASISEATTTTSPVANEIHFGDFFINDQGVFYDNQRGGERAADPIEVCSVLIPTAITRNKDGNDWGKEFLLFDPEGNEKKYHMKSAVLNSKPQTVITDLLHLGLMMSGHPRARTLLIQFLRSVSATVKKLSSAKPGWVGGRSFLLPNISFGPEEVLYSGDYSDHGISTSGNWKEHIGKYCSGNPRLVFAASSAFAAPLLSLIEMEGGGFHFRGESSVGKSTAGQVAASVYGSASAYVLSWNTTHNAIEQVAEGHNDCLMVLDELGEVDPAIVGEMLYMLANGQGKARMGYSRRKWKVLFLTSGELSLAEHMAKAGKDTKKGQEVRLLDIRADAGKGMGLFECLHGFDVPQTLAEYLHAATRRHYGTPIQEFLSALTASKKAIESECNRHMAAFDKLVSQDNVTGEVPRAIRRFGVVAAAGEIATRLKLTGWKKGEPIDAAEACFKAWMEHRRSFDPDTKIVGKVRKFIIENDHKFETEGGATIEDKVGYKKKSSFLILPEAFDGSVCAGTKPEEVAQALGRTGLLSSGKNRLKMQARINGTQTYFYSVSNRILDAA